MVKRIISKGKGNRDRFTTSKIQESNKNLIEIGYKLEKENEFNEFKKKSDNTARAIRMRKRTE